MKSKINTILPIALALVLPGMSLYSNPADDHLNQFGLLGSWLSSSILFYLIWYFLWFVWDWKHGVGKLWRALAVLAVFMTIHLTSYWMGLQDLQNVKWSLFFRLLLAVILIAAIQYSLRAQQNIARLLLEKEQLQTENYKVQLKALRAKIDPHFLFNSMNTLRSMVRQHHVNSERFVMSLSDFYRQTLKHNEHTTLQLSEELAVLRSYLFLMKSRNEEAVYVNIDVDPGLYGRHLPTLALQVVVENCFKHNSMTSKMPLRIDVSSTKDFYIRVTNNLQPKIGKEGLSGQGLDLLRKRYELMKVDDGLVVEKMPDRFSVQLKLLS